MEPKRQAFYTNWLFWIFALLVIILGATAYFLINEYFSKPLTLEPLGSGESSRIHVLKLKTPVNGFLVLRAGTKGSPGGVLTVSPYIFSGTYDNFYLQFIRDVSDTADNNEYYASVDYELKNNFYAIFYKDVNKNGVFDESIDVNIPQNIFGKKIQVNVVGGTQL